MPKYMKLYTLKLIYIKNYLKQLEIIITTKLVLTAIDTDKLEKQLKSW